MASALTGEFFVLIIDFLWDHISFGFVPSSKRRQPLEWQLVCGLILQSWSDRIETLIDLTHHEFQGFSGEFPLFETSSTSG
jgi:hypothetical protein